MLLIMVVPLLVHTVRVRLLFALLAFSVQKRSFGCFVENDNFCLHTSRMQEDSEAVTDVEPRWGSNKATKRAILRNLLMVWPFRVIRMRMQLRNSTFMHELGEILGRGQPTTGEVGYSSAFMQIIQTFQRGWRGILPAMLHDIVFNFCREQIYSLLSSLLMRIDKRRASSQTETGEVEQEYEEPGRMDARTAVEWQKVIMQISDNVLQNNEHDLTEVLRSREPALWAINLASANSKLSDLLRELTLHILSACIAAFVAYPILTASTLVVAGRTSTKELLQMVWDRLRNRADRLSGATPSSTRGSKRLGDFLFGGIVWRLVEVILFYGIQAFYRWLTVFLCTKGWEFLQGYLDTKVAAIRELNGGSLAKQESSEEDEEYEETR